VHVYYTKWRAAIRVCCVGIWYYVLGLGRLTEKKKYSNAKKILCRARYHTRGILLPTTRRPVTDVSHACYDDNNIICYCEPRGDDNIIMCFHSSFSGAVTGRFGTVDNTSYFNEQKRRPAATVCEDKYLGERNGYALFCYYYYYYFWFFFFDLKPRWRYRSNTDSRTRW